MDGDVNYLSFLKTVTAEFTNKPVSVQQIMAIQTREHVTFTFTFNIVIIDLCRPTGEMLILEVLLNTS